jgi:signal transduction histidine kinase
VRIDSKVWRSATFLLVIGLVAYAMASLLPGSGEGEGGPVIAYGAVELSYEGSTGIPAAGWRRDRLPNLKLLHQARANGLDPARFWARVRFDRRTFGERPLALYAEMIRDSYVVYLNGAEIYRSRASPSDESFSWNQPLFLPLPPSILRESDNQVVFRVETVTPNLLGLGALRIGPDRAVRAKFDRQYFLSNMAPLAVSAYLLILTIGAISFWIRRPDEPTYGWLALVGLVWIFRNLHYFLPGVPFGREFFWIATTDSIFVLSAVVFGFGVNYFRLPNARLFQALIFSFCTLEIVLRNVLIGSDRSEMPAFLLTFPMVILMIGMMTRACLRNGSASYWSMLAAIVAALLFGTHDMLFSFNLSKGAGFFLQPYGGLLIFIVFDIALTSRLQNALIDVEDVNLNLEARVTDVTRSLKRSEAARAELQVAHAVDGERERIMRDIHDGIGSSLLTSLAHARHRNESPETIAGLSRLLTDLRIGVDSLEPVGGDVVALLANLRHRMERELKGAGLAFIWRVSAAPPLAWLDPVGALHILRILREAIGNALVHAHVNAIEVRCGPSTNDGVAGVLIEIIDRGSGFDCSDASRGKGLGNMATRAEALASKFWCVSEVGKGTTVALWLPLAHGREIAAEPA